MSESIITLIEDPSRPAQLLQLVKIVINTTIDIITNFLNIF